jgi:vanillate O-demethylase monooxygenase subunit
MYLRNCWYVIGWSKELSETPIARRVLDEPIVVYRDRDGSIGALEDRCPHRHLPLSMGRVTGAYLQCGYHGMTFDQKGRCVGVPSQSLVPQATVRAYPTAERFGWIWVWMGEPEAADLEKLPDFNQLTDPEFAVVGDTIHVNAAYQLLVDNLLDLSHVGYVHRTTIGAAGMAEKGKLTVERTKTGVRVKRLVPDVSSPPLFEKSGLLPAGKNIDRYQFVEYVAPCFIKIHSGGAEVGTGVLEGKTEHGFNVWVLNAVTPETATTSNYFWAHVRRYALHDPATDMLFFNSSTEAFSEDKAVLEAQQRMINAYSDTWSIALTQDAGSIEARRVQKKLLTAEAEAAASKLTNGAIV